ncbi:MAG: hypothetical protein PW788_13865 [Micavibrio sp.]|nr:hypothetical protein [Micavibrio sp.]
MSILDDTPDDTTPLRRAFQKAAQVAVPVLLSLPVAAVLMAGLGYATKPAPDETDKFIDVAQTQYSNQMEALRQEYLKRSDHKIQLAIIDPDQFHLLTALGKSPDAAVSILSRHQDVTLDRNQIDSAAAETSHFMRYFDAKVSKQLGAETRHGFAPMALGNHNDDTCVYLPYEFRSDLIHQPKGWTAYDVVEFASRHELTHCLDTRYRAEQYEADTKGAKFSAAMKIEMLADISAFGEMIAKGKEPAMIDGILLQRRATYDEHFDVKGLIDLKATLAAGGLVAFRKLDEAQRDKLYHDIVDRSALDAANAEAFRALVTGSASMSIIRKDPGLKPAVQLYAERLPEEQPASPRYSKQEAAEVHAYDPLKALSTAGDVTAVIKLRAQMLDDLRNEQTSTAVYLAKLEKLNQAFTAQVQPQKTPPRYALAQLQNKPPKA